VNLRPGVPLREPSAYGLLGAVIPLGCNRCSGPPAARSSPHPVTLATMKVNPSLRTSVTVPT